MASASVTEVYTFRGLPTDADPDKAGPLWAILRNRKGVSFCFVLLFLKTSGAVIVVVYFKYTSLVNWVGKCFIVVENLPENGAVFHCQHFAF